MSNVFLASLISCALLFFVPALLTCLFVRREIPSLIVFSFAVLFQQLLFATCASFFGSYSISFPVAAILSLVSGVLVARGFTSRSPAKANNLSQDANARSSGVARFSGEILPWVTFIAIFIGYLWVRAHYSFINFNNNGDDVGVEKLFNLSLQQSFLFGSSYPPEWIWLGGEEIRYYVFLRSIPGVASWLARVVTGNAATGGVFFILSEAFFAALMPSLICAWIIFLGRRFQSGVLLPWIALCTGLVSFLGTHFHALSLGLSHLIRGRSLNWWLLSSQVVPHTDNQYPIWLAILGDNHAYAQVYFVQVMIWGVFIYLLSQAQFAWQGAVALGVLFSCLALSHPVSVAIDAAVMGPCALAVVGLCVFRRSWERLNAQLLHAVVTVGVAALFVVQLQQFGGQVKFVVPGTEIVSPFVAFLNLNFSVLIWMCIVMVLPVVAVLRERCSAGGLAQVARLVDSWLFVVPVIAGATALLWGLPALTILVACCSLTVAVLWRDTRSACDEAMVICAASSFFIWLLPEVIAFDHVLDSRTTWIRFQMGLRFWPEGFVLIPFCLTLASLVGIRNRSFNRVKLSFIGVFVLLLGLSHIPGVRNRIARTPHHATNVSPITVDGFREFNYRHPSDAAIVGFLRQLPANEKMQIAEACGLGDSRVPIDFAWTGRLAAFSGRPGVCGWARHAMLYNNPLHQRGFIGESVEGRTAGFLRAYLDFFTSAEKGDVTRANAAVMALRALGVTHITFGEFEKRLFPGFSVAGIDPYVSVTLQFATGDGYGVYKIAS